MPLVPEAAPVLIPVTLRQFCLFLRLPYMDHIARILLRLASFAQHNVCEIHSHRREYC